MIRLLASSALILLNVHLLAAHFQGGAQMSYDFGDTLMGQVRAIRTERAPILDRDGKYVEGSRILLQETIYTAQGHKATEINYDNDGAISIRRVFSYNVDGQLKEIIEYNSEGSLIRRRVYIPDRNVIKEVTYKGDGTLDSDKIISTFDDTGRQTSVATFGAEGALSMKAVITYRNEGKVIEVATCASNTNRGMIAPSSGGRMVVLTDAAKDRMKGIPPCFDGLLISKSIFTLDNAGSIAEVATYTHDNSLIGKQIYEREFDSIGNWIKETMSNWNAKLNSFQKSHVTYRTITYY
jgi:hypothetical protein